jgi:hypothetical protein
MPSDVVGGAYERRDDQPAARQPLRTSGHGTSDRLTASSIRLPNDAPLLFLGWVGLDLPGVAYLTASGGFPYLFAVPASTVGLVAALMSLCTLGLGRRCMPTLRRPTPTDVQPAASQV